MFRVWVTVFGVVAFGKMVEVTLVSLGSFGLQLFGLDFWV